MSDGSPERALIAVLVVALAAVCGLLPFALAKLAGAFFDPLAVGLAALAAVALFGFGALADGVRILEDIVAWGVGGAAVLLAAAAVGGGIGGLVDDAFVRLLLAGLGVVVTLIVMAFVLFFVTERVKPATGVDRSFAVFLGIMGLFPATGAIARWSWVYDGVVEVAAIEEAMESASLLREQLRARHEERVEACQAKAAELVAPLKRTGSEASACEVSRDTRGLTREVLSLAVSNDPWALAASLERDACPAEIDGPLAALLEAVPPEGAVSERWQARVAELEAMLEAMPELEPRMGELPRWVRVDSDDCSGEVAVNYREDRGHGKTTLERFTCCAATRWFEVGSKEPLGGIGGRATSYPAESPHAASGSELGRIDSETRSRASTLARKRWRAQVNAVLAR